MAAIDSLTVTLLASTLSSGLARKLFSTIANKRIAEAESLKAGNPEADRELAALKDADLISAGENGQKYYVTAKGLKVARDLENIPAGTI